MLFEAFSNLLNISQNILSEALAAGFNSSTSSILAIIVG